MRKVYVNILIRAIMELEEGIEVGEVIQEMRYDLESNLIGAEIVDTEIIDYKVNDSK